MTTAETTWVAFAASSGFDPTGWAAALAAGVSVTLLVWLAYRFVADTPPAGAQGRDQPPPAFRMTWWLIAAAAHYTAPTLSWRYRRVLDKRLVAAGLDQALAPRHILAAQWLIAMVVAAVMALLHMLTAGAPGVTGALVMAAAGGLGWTWPRLWLRDCIALRQRALLRALPFMLDMTTLCVEAGLNLSGALQQAVRKGPPGPLRDELQRVLGDIRTGVPRAQALRDFATRVNAPAVTALVGTLVQADTLGMNLAQILRAQADQQRSDRFLRAERLAMEAPVKMLFPLIAFIFPCTFVVIAFPIGVKLLELAQ
jgi:tight adherence protein C